MDKVKIAKARLEAAELRLTAARRDEGAAGYLRQARKPAYEGQEIVCMGKHATSQAISDQERAQADLIIAQAEADHGQK